MTLDGAFHELDTRLGELEQAFDNLLWAVVQGQGPGWSHAVLDHYDAATHDAVGLLHEARGAASAADGQPDLVRLRATLVTIQERINRISVCLYSELISYERKTTLYSLKRKGRPWTIWIEGVDDALGRCPQPLYDVGRALLQCWQELVDRANLLYVSAQFSSTGMGKIMIEGGSAGGKQREAATNSALHDSTS